MNRSLDETATQAVRIGHALDQLAVRRARGEPVATEAFLADHQDIADALRPLLPLVEALGAIKPANQHRVLAGLLSDECGGESAARRHLGAYRVDGLIGHGGMGFVLRAYDERLRRRVALKVLRPELCDTPSGVARFQREARAAAALSHPNVVTVYDVGCEQGLPYIAMEHVDGPTLAGLIGACGPLPEMLIRVIAGQLFDALDAAHGAGLIHRDVKPSNVLIDASGAVVGRAGGDQERSAADWAAAVLADPPSWPRLRVKLADFGLARMRWSHSEVTAEGSVIGTPEYMSPEQVRGDADIDLRTDLYSAGAVLYEMLSGQPPFRGESSTATMRLIAQAEPPGPCAIHPSADRALASLAVRLLAKRPGDRLASAQDVLRTLESRRHVPDLGARRRRRARVLRAAGVLALAGAVVAGLRHYLATRDGPPRQPLLTQTRLVSVKGEPLRLLATFDHESFPRTLHTFPRVLAAAGAEARIVDLDGQGRQIVVAGTGGQLRGECVFAFQPDGSPVWSLKMPPRMGIDWPDTRTDAYWECRDLIVADLDGSPGEELVVLATQLHEYPCCISIVDPRIGAVASTFWHCGHFRKLAVIPEYFSDGRPALAAWGQNNKLDGFDTNPGPDSGAEDPIRTKHNVVLSLAILDPLAMNGLGPPRTSRVGIDPVTPEAYAFLDLEMVNNSSFDITNVLPVTASPREERDAPCLSLNVGCGADGSGSVIVNRHLEVEALVPAGESPCVSREFWDGRWRIVVRARQYVDLPEVSRAP